MQKLLYRIVTVATFSFFAQAAYANVLPIDPSATIYNSSGQSVGTINFDVDSNGVVSNVMGTVQGNSVGSGSGEDVNNSLDIDFTTSGGSYHIEPYSGKQNVVIFPDGSRGAAAMPELSTWLMLIVGFGLVAVKFAYAKRPIGVRNFNETSHSEGSVWSRGLLIIFLPRLSYSARLSRQEPAIQSSFESSEGET